MTSSPEEMTQLLVAWSNGDQSALDRLVSLVHEELHRLAKSWLLRDLSGEESDEA